MTRLFLPEATLEEWAIDDKADIRDAKLVLTSEQASYPVVAAVHFTQLVSGTDDEGLVGKVKTETQLEKLGAEQMADSVVLGENAYEVVPGYVAHMPAEAPAVAAKPAAQKQSVKGAAAETDLLAAFLLNKLS